MNKVKIIEASNELGLGGTEHVVQLYSKFLDKEHFEVLVVGLHKGGERVKLIQELGVPVVILDGDFKRLSMLLQETDVFHWHGDGSLNPVLFNIIRENKPKMVIQTNIFGAYTHSPLYDSIDYDLYVSKMILIRRMIYDQNLKNIFASKRKALYNPVDADHINSLLPTDDELEEFKRENNIQDYFITGRIGRSDESKFDYITLDAFAEFSTRVHNARFLLVGATPNMLAYAKQLNIADKLIIFDTTPDLRTLLFYYRTMDVFLAASKLGESFGLVIAEAMTAGIPVVTISTPNRDNAQIELVENGYTGLVVERDTATIASALFFLYKNEKVRTAFAAAAKQKVRIEYKADQIVQSLENLICHHLGLPLLNPEKSLITDFSMEIVIDYANRCTDLWKPANDQA